MAEKNKKVLFVVAYKDFRDEEYFRPKAVLEADGFEVLTTSTEPGIASGVEGGEAKIDLVVDEVKIDDFDVLVFIGGAGAAKHIDNKRVHRLAQEAFAKNKIIAAICIAPAILAKAGILEGKKATVWSSALDRQTVQLLKEEGAIYENKPVVTDGKIITANGPQVADEFGKAILKVSKSD